MKKTLILLLALLMLLGVTPVTALATEESYVYPMETVSKLEGTIANASNKYVIAPGWHGAVIDLRGLDYDTVTITKNPGAPNMGYAFLREMLVVGQVPDYAGDHYAVVWDTKETATLQIPNDATYLYIYYNSKEVVYLPSSVVFKKAAESEAPEQTPDEPILDATSIKVATWNIGHFSIGKNTSTKIKDDQFQESSQNYCRYIYDEVGADLITLNEYSAMFTPSYRAKNTLFNKYTAAQLEGPQYRYSCNALFSKLPVDNLRVCTFECNKTATIQHTSLIKATDYYYLQGEITLGGESVVVVTAHLGFDSLRDPDTVCLDQINELIRVLSGYDRVLLMGDWNARYFAYFDRFVEAGYTLGNTNSGLATFAYDSTNRALDNIIVKGLEVSGFKVYPTFLSDHYAVSATVSLSYDTPGHAHEYSAVVTQPTCTQEGCTTYTCAGCGDSYKTAVVEAKGHVQKTVEAVAPTCTEAGLTEGVRCTVCGEFLQAQSEVAALGHSYGDWETAADGQKERTCALCGAVHREGEPEPLPPSQTEAAADAPQTEPSTPAPTTPGTPRAEKPAPVLPVVIVAVLVVAAGTVAFLLVKRKKKTA